MKEKLKNILKTCGWERCIVALFLVVVMAVGSVSLIVLPKEDFSPDENRMLEEFPTLSGENLIDGSFMTGVENFVSDHFMLRRDFIALHTQIMLASGKKDLASNYGITPAEGGVYFGKNDHIYEVLLPPDRTTVLEDNINSITGFSANAGLPLTILAVPSGAQEQAANLPDFAPEYDQREVLKAIEEKADENTTVVDTFDALSLENGDYYYKTDHHWNLEGAFVGYTEMAKAMGFTPVPREQYEFEKVSDSFYGTLYSKAIYWGQKPDDFYLPRYQGENTLTQQTGENVRDDLYWTEEYLDKKDKYSTFLGGNHSVDVIRNSAVKEGKLLLIKDSYANCMIPFLAQHFAEIHVVDLRYFNQDIYQYIEENGITQLAAVYSIKQLCDTDVASKLLR